MAAHCCAIRTAASGPTRAERVCTQRPSAPWPKTRTATCGSAPTAMGCTACTKAASPATRRRTASSTTPSAASSRTARAACGSGPRPASDGSAPTASSATRFPRESSRVRDGRVDVLTRQDGLPSDSIRAVFEDREGSLWLGGIGLGQLKDGTVLSYGQTQGLADEDVYAVTTAPRKGLWVGTSAGEVALFARGRFSPVAGRDVLHGATGLALREDRAGRL